MFSFLCCVTQGADEDFLFDQELANAATKIQKNARGMLVRKRANAEVEKTKAAFKAAGSESNIREDLLDDANQATESRLLRGNTMSRVMTLTVVSARGLRDVVGRRFRGRHTSCPFVVCQMGNVHVKTGVKQDSLNPVWKETFQIVDPDASLPMTFGVYHPARKGKPETCLGTAELDCVSFGFEGELELTNTGLKSGSAYLNVNIDWAEVRQQSMTAAMVDAAAVRWIVRYRSIGLRTGPGTHTDRVGIDLLPGEEFDVVEVIEGANDQRFLRLKDGRGWAFTLSPKDKEVLAMPLNEVEEIQDEENENAAGSDRLQGAASKGVAMSWILGGKAKK